MSIHSPGEAHRRRLTAPAMRALKAGGRVATPLVWLTAYTRRMAELLDPHADLLLVGDSVAQAIYGMESTLGVTVDMMVAHGRAVVRGASHAMVAIDLPFGSYEPGPARAFATAARVLAQTGAQAVKLEGGRPMADTVAFLVARGVPVIGHVGLTPQSVHTLGGYRTRGRDEAEAAAIVDDARAVAAAGAFSVVVEGVRAGVAETVQAALDVPVIGIGASPACDGQVLVVDDLLGLTARAPRFVRRMAELGAEVDRAAGAWASAVRERSFPAEAEMARG